MYIYIYINTDVDIDINIYIYVFIISKPTRVDAATGAADHDAPELRDLAEISWARHLGLGDEEFQRYAYIHTLHYIPFHYITLH